MCLYRKEKETNKITPILIRVYIFTSQRKVMILWHFWTLRFWLVCTRDDVGIFSYYNLDQIMIYSWKVYTVLIKAHARKYTQTYMIKAMFWCAKLHQRKNWSKTCQTIFNFFFNKIDFYMKLKSNWLFNLYNKQKKNQLLFNMSIPDQKNMMSMSMSMVTPSIQGSSSMLLATSTQNESQLC